MYGHALQELLHTVQANYLFSDSLLPGTHRPDLEVHNSQNNNLRYLLHPGEISFCPCEWTGMLCSFK